MSSSECPLNNMDAITLRNQIESPLLRLPAELRNKVYDYVFRVGNMKFSPTRFKVAQGRHNTASYTVNEIGTSPPYQPLFVLLQSRLVCRQYYAETKLLIFEINPLRARPEDLPEPVRQMPKNAQDVISIIRVDQRVSWRYRKVQKGFESFKSFANLGKLEVQPCMPGVSENLLPMMEKWFRPYIGRAVEIKVLKNEVLWQR